MPSKLKPDGEYYLNLSAKLKTGQGWAPAGHEVAYAQIPIPVTISHVPPIDTANIPDISKTETSSQ